MVSFPEKKHCEDLKDLKEFKAFKAIFII